LFASALEGLTLVYLTWSQHRTWVRSASLLIQTNPVALSITSAGCYNRILCNGTELDFGNFRQQRAGLYFCMGFD